MDVPVASLTDLMVVEHARIQEMLEEVNIASYEDKMRPWNVLTDSSSTSRSIS